MGLFYPEVFYCLLDLYFKNILDYPFEILEGRTQRQLSQILQAVFSVQLLYDAHIT